MLALKDWFSTRPTSRSKPDGRPRLDLGDEGPICPFYAIGDVHGRLDLLDAAETKVAQDIARTRRPGVLVLLGDYVDRGPASSAVIDHLCHPHPRGLRRITLRGNHDDLFVRFLTEERGGRDWMEIGGDATLASYGVDIKNFSLNQPSGWTALRRAAQQAVPPAHIALLQAMPALLRIGRLVFVHAGLRPGVPLEAQEDQDLLWIREPFLSKGPELPFMVVHGHTPSQEPSFGRQRIGIDTGAYQSGRLTVVKLDGRNVSFL
ncbi:hypothetical protein BJF93_18890 [Xaviernesmea oryzae]|uniref:Calcineurin-like phosphoesterase domain-containing protein n=1 Tax=Xaviernesmea oryzae TaxID=464029 RepID=A0A1Q9B2Q9_9HYPH|nr:hypothetical protein BJF93_18890 [Xaviernesmea oryzae]